MSTSTSFIPSTPSPEVLRLLQEAVHELRQSPNETIMSSRFQTSHDVADDLERLSRQLVDGDSAAGRELYAAFCATSVWDEACGSHYLGNQLCEALQPYWPGAR